MNLSRTLLLSLFFVAPLSAQTTPLIDTYIRSSWDTLMRSMSECKSVVDSKITSAPVLYLPAGMAVPPAVVAMQQQCHVEVVHLPRKISSLGDIKISEIPRQGLLYLPNPYVVPGGRFNEMYGWDSYFILLGLLHDGRVNLARGMVENFLFEIENYGAVLNANRTYYLTRSQPPLLAAMIDEVYSRTQDKLWLARAYALAVRDYSLWTSAPHRAGATGLARYTDLGSGPVPEMADDSTYYPDVVRWLLTHPGDHGRDLVKASAHPDAREAAALAVTSCDLASKVCAAAYADGFRLSADFYHGDRAMRESGFDTSFRFGPFSDSTEQFAPVCLNSLLFRYAQLMASFATTLHKPAEVAEWQTRAADRKAAINQYLWHAELGRFTDFNYVAQTPSSYNYITMYYPLWAGLATPQQATALDRQLPLFEHEGGLAMSDNASGTQWDLPFGWAPTQWFAIAGLNQYGFHADAQRAAVAFRRTVQTNYLRDGTIREKYNVVSGSANIELAAGYRSNVIGFGWTNGVYELLGALFPQASATTPPAPLVAPGTSTLLTRDQLEPLLPATVFYKGRTATVQLRNAVGIRFASGALTLAVKVDTQGYASADQDTYQDYLLSEVPLHFDADILPAGAYGIGFLAGTFQVMDLGGHRLLSIPSTHDALIARPTPLKFVEDQAPGAFRLYSGRDYVTLSQGPAKP